MPRLAYPFLPLPSDRRLVLRPVIPIHVTAQGVLYPVPLAGLIDTGAPFTVLPRDVAEALGCRFGRARRVEIAVAGWHGRAPLVDGLTFRLSGPDLDRDGAEAVIEISTTALLVPPEHFRDFGLLGQQGFLDGVGEVCFLEHEKRLEIRTL